MVLDQILEGEARDGGAALAKVSYSLEGGEWGAVADREYRRCPVAAPGGYRWCPREGEEVLLLRTGDGDLCAGVSGESLGLAPGEVEIAAWGGAIRLGKDGSVSLTSGGGASVLLRGDGAVVINGQVFAPPEAGR